jgi:hypothetical protein
MANSNLPQPAASVAIENATNSAAEALARLREKINEVVAAAGGLHLIHSNLQPVGTVDDAVLGGVANSAMVLDHAVHAVSGALDNVYGILGDLEDAIAPVDASPRHPAPRIPTIKVGDLRAALEPYEDDFDLSFSGLRFYRVKTRGENIAQVEFDQPVYLNEHGCVVVENVSD